MRFAFPLALALAACNSGGASSPDATPDAATFTVTAPTQLSSTAQPSLVVKDIVADRDSVYYVGSVMPGGYDLRRYDLRAGVPENIAGGAESVNQLAMDDTAVYWVEQDTGTLRTVAKSGGGPSTLPVALDGAVSVAAGGGRLYWIGANGARSARASDGGDVQHLDDVASQVDEIDLDAARARLLFIASDGVYAMPVAGGARTKIGAAVMGDLAVGTTRLAFTAWKNGGLVVADLDGGHPQTYFAGAYEGRVAIDGDTIYWTDVTTTPGAAGVHRLAPTDGAPVTIAPTAAASTAVAVTPDAVFYGDGAELWAAPR